MTTATRRPLRLNEHDANLTTTTPAQTIIITRPSPPKQPREERVRIARPPNSTHGGPSAVSRKLAPLPLDVRLTQAKVSVRLVLPDDRQQSETTTATSAMTMREPEIVDLAPPSARPWERNRRAAWTSPPCPPSRPPPPPMKTKRALRSTPSVASRQSEVSFGILDHYFYDESSSPLQSPEMPIESDSVKRAKVNPAIERFEFGLPSTRREMAAMPATPESVRAGADEHEEMQLVPLSPRPYEEEQEDDQIEPPRAQKYSLFPVVKEVMPSSTTHRLAQLINDSPNEAQRQLDEAAAHARQREPGCRPRLLSGARMTTDNNIATACHRVDTTSSSAAPQEMSPHTLATTTIPSPSYHPRNPSLSFSSTSRLASASIGSASVNGNGSSTNASRRIPLRILSSSSTATTATATTLRSSTSASPGSTIASQQKPLLSRWSEDTALASPTTAAAVLGCRTSFGSLVDGEVYPACFFEDDEEEEEEEAVPLRRRRRGRNGGKGWRWWLCCGGKA